MLQPMKLFVEKLKILQNIVTQLNFINNLIKSHINVFTSLWCCVQILCECMSYVGTINNSICSAVMGDAIEINLSSPLSYANIIYIHWEQSVDYFPPIFNNKNNTLSQVKYQFVLTLKIAKPVWEKKINSTPPNCIHAADRIQTRETEINDFKSHTVYTFLWEFDSFHHVETITFFYTTVTSSRPPSNPTSSCNINFNLPHRFAILIPFGYIHFFYISHLNSVRCEKYTYMVSSILQPNQIIV